MKTGKRILSVLLSVLLLLSTVAIGVIVVSAEGTYFVGDIIEYGTYPQSRVDETEVLRAAAEKAQSDGDGEVIPEEAASYYVDSVNGDDSNDGKSPETAWKTAGRAAEKQFIPGDSLLFHRGQVFTASVIFGSSGTQDSPVTVSAYGEGKLPVLTTDSASPVIFLYSNSNFIVDSLEITAPDGLGLLLYAEKVPSSNIIIQNCVFHDIFNRVLSKNSHSSNCAIVLENDREDGILKDITVRNCEIYNCDYGAHVYGISREWSGNYESPQKSYNQGIVFDGVYMHDIRYDGLVLQSCYKTTVRNSRFINCAGRCSWACAPLWMHHSDSVTVEYCEIAGSTNQQDGMAIDFDGRTTNSTYQYIYSHDNNRFIRNCCYDSDTRNRGNTVQFCYSENDGGLNSFTYKLMNFKELSIWFVNSMDNFTFKNNTIVNSGAYSFGGLKNSEISGNVFVLKSGMSAVTSFFYALMAAFSGADIRNNSFKGMIPPFSAKNNVPYSDNLIEGDPYALIDSSQSCASSAPIGCFAGG
ncbi:MAG: right-handed parallel beta-helix repeat-containing protein [Clostridia bacterium]|nr:right-handed parallel beta-helix repeat-containing protein [Clostridia bacterium]